MFGFLLFVCAVAAAAWWIFQNRPVPNDDGDAASGLTRSGSREGGDGLYHWLSRVPRVFTQPHILAAGGTRLTQGTVDLDVGSSDDTDTDTDTDTGFRGDSGAGSSHAGSGSDAGSRSDSGPDSSPGSASDTRSGAGAHDTSARPAPATPAPVPAPASVPVAAPAPAPAPAARKQALFEAPAERDDLTRISGIGPVMEELLNDLGVVSFAQLAAFTPADVERVDAALDDFPGRIVRDDWVGQARGLVRGRA